MGFHITQKEQSKISQECGKILVDFVNADSLEDAIYFLDESFLKIFRTKLFDVMKEFSERKKYIKEAQQRMIKLFEDLQFDKTLKNSATISYYNADYYRLCHCLMKPDARFQNNSDLIATLKSISDNQFEAALAFLVFQYIKDENRKPIIKCSLPRCKIYFVAERITAKYCSNRHKMCQFRLLRNLFFNEEKKTTTALSVSSKRPAKKNDQFSSTG
jgi:hypothetical protein